MASFTPTQLTLKTYLVLINLSAPNPRDLSALKQQLKTAVREKEFSGEDLLTMNVMIERLEPLLGYDNILSGHMERRLTPQEHNTCIARLASLNNALYDVRVNAPETIRITGCDAITYPGSFRGLRPEGLFTLKSKIQSMDVGSWLQRIKAEAATQLNEHQGHVDKQAQGLQEIFKALQSCGKEPADEIADLQNLLGSAWALMTPWQRELFGQGQAARKVFDDRGIPNPFADVPDEGTEHPGHPAA